MSFIQRTDRRLLASALYVSFVLVGTSSNTLAADASLAGQDPEPPFDQERFNTEKPERNWSLILGAGAIYQPEYEGGDEFASSPFRSSSSPMANGWRSIRPVSP